MALSKYERKKSKIVAMNNLQPVHRKDLPPHLER